MAKENGRAARNGTKYPKKRTKPTCGRTTCGRTNRKRRERIKPKNPSQNREGFIIRCPFRAAHTALLKSHCRLRQCSLFCLCAPFPQKYKSIFWGPLFCSQ